MRHNVRDKKGRFVKAQETMELSKSNAMIFYKVDDRHPFYNFDELLSLYQYSAIMHKIHKYLVWGTLTFRKGKLVSATGQKHLGDVPYAWYAQVLEDERCMGNPFEEYQKQNIGEYNLGMCNAGFFNAGLCNQGIYNDGRWNAGIGCKGIFNTKERFYAFNKPVDDYTDMNCIHIPNFLCFQGVTRDFKTEARAAFHLAVKKPDWLFEYKKLLDLPNFDYAIFEEITGISKKMLDDSIKHIKCTKKRKGKLLKACN